jgi:D-serine deaminase-like pyridoxal phosphate-dependent protein
MTPHHSPKNLANVDTPAVVLDLDRLESNIGRMAAVAREAGVALRPHAKSHKLPQVARLQLAAGATGLTVAKLGEAEVFVEAGVGDILVAYPIWGESKWHRLCELRRRAQITTCADSAEVVDGLSRAATAHGVEIPILVEVDTGFERCGVAGPREAVALARRITESPGTAFAGVLSFAGQSYGAQPGPGLEAVAASDARRLLGAAEAIRECGITVPVVSAGGTPTARQVARISGITEVRPGAYAFSDRDQAALGWGTLADCALTVVTTVVSRPTPERAVIDAGTKAFSSDQSIQDAAFGAIIDHPELTPLRLTEEHGILHVPAGMRLDIGTRLRVIPNHGCGTLNMHDNVTVVRDEDVIEEWTVAARAKMR